MAAYGNGQYGPEALFKVVGSAYGPLTSPSVTTDAGYTATVSGGNLTVIGPVGTCALTVKDGATTVGTFTVQVLPVASDLVTARSDIDSAASAASTNASAITTNTSAIASVNTTLGSNPQGTDASVAARLARLDAGISASAAVLYVRKNPQTATGTWPARPTATNSVLVFWDGPPNTDGSGPPTVSSGTGGMLPGDKWLSHP